MKTLHNAQCLTRGDNYKNMVCWLNKVGLSDFDTIKPEIVILYQTCFQIVKDYKVKISKNSIKESGFKLLDEIVEAIEAGLIKERTNQDGIVCADWDDIIFIERPTMFDNIIDSKKDNGTKIVEILRYIKKNYNDLKENKVFTTYCNDIDRMNFCITIREASEIVSSLINIEEELAKKIIYAMSFKGHYEVKAKRECFKGRRRGSYISDQYIYLGSVK